MSRNGQAKSATEAFKKYYGRLRALLNEAPEGDDACPVTDAPDLI